LADIGRAVANIALSVVGYTTLGFVVGIVLRSSVAAVIVGFVYLLPLENIFSAVVSGADRWLPGQLLISIAQGGNSSASYSAALLTVAVYMAIVAVVGALLFAKRDVTA
jgi:hypothetical protein